MVQIIVILKRLCYKGILEPIYSKLLIFQNKKLKSRDFPGGSDSKKNLLAMRETWVRPLGWEDPLEEGMAPTPVFLPRESHGWRSLVGYSPWSRKESDTTEQLLSLRPDEG